MSGISSATTTAWGFIKTNNFILFKRKTERKIGIITADTILLLKHFSVINQRVNFFPEKLFHFYNTLFAIRTSFFFYISTVLEHKDVRVALTKQIEWKNWNYFFFQRELLVKYFVNAFNIFTDSL